MRLSSSSLSKTKIVSLLLASLTLAVDRNNNPNTTSSTILAFAPRRLFPTSLASSCAASSISNRLQMSAAQTFVDSLSKAASEALGRPVTLETARGGGYAGGGGASTSAVQDKDTGDKYFVKSASGARDMLKAEYLGVKAMSETDTIRVPKPVAFGEHGNTAFVIFEYLEFTGGGDQRALGYKLAKMHRHMSENGKFGFEVDNTIGATHQPNQWEDNWPEFWDKHRLGHMLKLTGNAGLSADKIEKLRQKTKELLSHNPGPSLIHGDLWGGVRSIKIT